MDKALLALRSLKGKVCVVGSMNIDYTMCCEVMPRPGQTICGGPLCIYPGGKSSNQAAAASLLGVDVSLVGLLGQDEASRFLLDKLQDVGVATNHIEQVEGASGSTIIMVDGDAENAIIYAAGANALLSREYVRQHAYAIEEASVLGLCLESPLEALVEAVQIAQKSGVEVLLNVSPFTRELPQELLDNCDILLINEHELADLTCVPLTDNLDEIDWTHCRMCIQEFGFERAVITLGAQGSVVIDGTDTVRIPAHAVTCKDTTGCGDSFMGCILAGLTSGFSLADACRSASYVAAYAATGLGAQSSYGTPEQIIEAFETHH